MGSLRRPSRTPTNARSPPTSPIRSIRRCGSNNESGVSAMTTTEEILTGTGVPHPRPGRAGAGVLVRCDGVALQFDAGRATVLRLVEAGISPSDLSALFVTHVHSDHVVDLP